MVTQRHVMLLAFLLFAACSCGEVLLHAEFELFCSRFNKSYESEGARLDALAVFSENVRFIDAHNRRNLSYTLAQNEFSDLTFDEFASMRLGFNSSASIETAASFPLVEAPRAEPQANNINWSALGKVSPIKNQGNCGSCWAFSAVTALESQHAIRAGAMALLSEQQLVDCSWPFNNRGCSGGAPIQAYAYLIEAAKISDTEAAYPYQAVQGPCRFNPQGGGSLISRVGAVPPGDEATMAAVLQTVGPVAACLQVLRDFQFYSAGIYSNPTCASSAAQSNHCVGVVGFDVSEGVTPFWIVRNSWGPSWGQGGYIFVARGANMCGIASQTYYPLL